MYKYYKAQTQQYAMLKHIYLKFGHLIISDCLKNYLSSLILNKSIAEQHNQSQYSTNI